MDTVGPITRTVEDCAITLQAIAGYDPKDRYTWDQPVPDYRQALSGDISGIRVGILREKIEADDVEPEVRDAVLAAAGVLGELGAPVQDATFPLLRDGGAVSKCLTDMEGAAAHYERLKTQVAEYDHNTRVRLLTAILTPAQVYYKAQKIRTLLRQQVLELLQTVDVLILPTAPSPAPLIPDGPGIKSQADAHSRMSGVRSFTGPFNLASVPAISVPCGFTSDNLPVSLQIVGRPFEEATLMRVAYAYEQNTPWHNRKPPM
jgi:aspartyl-tRNA(Asn)/glutamyl-tRNA(Gln) amidotransferase subunit A